MKRLPVNLCSLAALLCCVPVYADTIPFGIGGNRFTMEFVTIGNPGNADDTTGTPNPVGSVDYTYSMGKYEVSRDMIAKANAEGNLEILVTDMTGFGGNGANRPVTGVSWNEAARFVNWLNTSVGSPHAYKFNTQPGDVGYNSNANISLWVSGDAGFNAANPFRNSLARFVLPSVDEWYKAAYHDATAGTSGTFFNFPTGSDTAPTVVTSGTSANTAVHALTIPQGPADITQAGGLSSYGTMGQGGNVFEWEETETDLVNNSVSSVRGMRGGSWLNPVLPTNFLSSSARNSFGPGLGLNNIGFRVASIADAFLAGDFDEDGDVDGRDFLLWQRGGSPSPLSASDLAAWQANHGVGPLVASTAVPEPSALMLLSLAAVGGKLTTRRRFA